MAVQQSSHRVHLESRVIDNDVFLSRVGLFMGFLLALSAIGAGVFLISLD